VGATGASVEMTISEGYGASVEMTEFLEAADSEDSVRCARSVRVNAYRNVKRQWKGYS
jgi:hypothetical protein